MDNCPNDGLNVASRPAVAVEMACCHITTQSFARRRIKLRFSKALIAKTWFSM
jgi:hypothetical protein